MNDESLGVGELKPVKICIRSSELIGTAALMQPRFQLIWSFQGGEGLEGQGDRGLEGRTSSALVAKLGTLVIFDPAGREETKRRLLRLVSFQPHLTAEVKEGSHVTLEVVVVVVGKPHFLQEEWIIYINTIS